MLTENQKKWLEYLYQEIRKFRDEEQDEQRKGKLTNMLASILLIRGY